MTSEIQHALAAAIEALPLEMQTAIILHDVEGLSYEGICEAMSCSIGTARHRVGRGRELIAAALLPLVATNYPERSQKIMTPHGE